MAASAELCAAVLRLQARHVRELYEALDAVKSLPLRPRVARQLASLARRHGVSRGCDVGETRIGIRLAQEQIAQLVGCSRQRINGELKQLELAGAIRIDHEGFVICNRHALGVEGRRPERRGSSRQSYRAGRFADA
ncbi:Crp-like helix-turn-helix domain protein [compost metagenome]